MPVATEERIILNLGCGNKRFKGAINIDFEDNYSGTAPDVCSDIRKLPYPDNHADEIHAIHVIEHFYTWEVVDTLKEWFRVLKPGGALCIECPDLNKILMMLIQGETSAQKTMLGLYGSQTEKNEHMVHKWTYTWHMLLDVLTLAGFVNAVEKEARFHIPKRDIRVECYKPEQST